MSSDQPADAAGTGAVCNVPYFDPNNGGGYCGLPLPCSAHPERKPAAPLVSGDGDATVREIIARHGRGMSVVSEAFASVVGREAYAAGIARGRELGAGEEAEACVKLCAEEKTSTLDFVNKAGSQIPDCTLWSAQGAMNASERIADAIARRAGRGTL